MTKPLSYQIILFCHTDLSCHTELCVAKWSILKSLSYWAQRSIHKPFTLSYWAFARKRSIHEFKVRICILKYEFFILNSMDFSLCANALRSKWRCLAILQVDFSPFYKRLKMTMWIFVFFIKDSKRQAHKFSSKFKPINKFTQKALSLETLKTTKSFKAQKPRTQKISKLQTPKSLKHSKLQKFKNPKNQKSQEPPKL